uniref:NADH dehydrogenase subunit 3 n=1 Tax=Picea glauca TaxID=3330 RepID=A0A101LYD2_PICGL|nr:hypothetical protein ABT39_MTgene5831 [Picea glauca]QHR92313.1 hypothetical protein Q903MT_gene6355 [Picea sitchensis]
MSFLLLLLMMGIYLFTIVIEERLNCGPWSVWDMTVGLGRVSDDRCVGK